MKKEVNICEVGVEVEVDKIRLLEFSTDNLFIAREPSIILEDVTLGGRCMEDNSNYNIRRNYRT